MSSGERAVDRAGAYEVNRSLLEVWVRLFTAAELEALAGHEEASVRRWALSAWARLDPDEGVALRARALLDADPGVVHEATARVVARGEARLVPVLHRAIHVLEGPCRVAFLEALEGCEEATLAPFLVDRLRRPDGGEEVVALLRALACMRHEQVWLALMPLWQQLNDDDALSGLVVRGLMTQARVGDVAAIVERWRALPWAEAGTGIGRGLAHALGMPDEVGGALHLLKDHGPDGVWDAIERETGEEEFLEDALLDRLVEAWERGGAQGLRKALPGVFSSWSMAQQHDVRAWMDGVWGHPRRDLRSAVVLCDRLLSTMATGEVDEVRAMREATLGLGLLATLVLRPALSAEAVVEDALLALTRPTAEDDAVACDRLDQAAIGSDLWVHVLRETKAPSALVRLLGRIEGLASVSTALREQVLSMLEHPGPRVRAAAIACMVSMGHEAVATLAEQVALRGGVLSAMDCAVLGRLPYAEALDLLVESLSVQAPAPALVDALAATGHPRALEALEAAGCGETPEAGFLRMVIGGS